MDPRTDTEYSYSLLYSKKEFQLAAALEDDGSDQYSAFAPLVDTSYAAAGDTKGTAYVL
jgi:hypothetical protein